MIQRAQASRRNRARALLCLVGVFLNDIGDSCTKHRKSELTRIWWVEVARGLRYALDVQVGAISTEHSAGLNE
jgi:hypothetical protein